MITNDSSLAFSFDGLLCDTWCILLFTGYESQTKKNNTKNWTILLKEWEIGEGIDYVLRVIQLQNNTYVVEIVCSFLLPFILLRYSVRLKNVIHAHLFWFWCRKKSIRYIVGAIKGITVNNFHWIDIIKIEFW